ncbi:MAG TPA: hypothetical protein VMT95_01800, partial [Candidatus Binatia bacterium]|nr:hypothetical protein [Candidatus Binatia bacterium]
MRAFTLSLAAGVAAALLASCSGGNPGSMTSSVPGTGSAAKVQALKRAGAVSIIPRSALPKGPQRL